MGLHSKRVVFAGLLAVVAVVAVVATHWADLAVKFAPKKTARVSDTDLSRRAHAFFLASLNAGKYENLPEAFRLLTAAYLQNPRDAAISFHLGKGMHSIEVKPGSWRMAAGVAVSPMQLDEVITGMILSGLLERYPNVRVVFGEAGLGWVPYLLARLDHEYDKYRDLIHDATLTMRPRDYFRRQVFLTYEEDNLGIELLPHIGATNVLWASDYPHGDSTWPHSRQAIVESGLGQLDEADRRLILWDNAASLYNIV